MSDQEKETVVTPAGVTDLLREQLDASDSEGAASPTPTLTVETKLAYLLLDATIPRSLRRQLDRSDLPLADRPGAELAPTDRQSRANALAREFSRGSC